MHEKKSVFQSDAFLKQADIDLLKRALPANILYMVLWPVVIAGTAFYDVEPVLSWGLAIALIGISLLRIIQGKLMKHWYHRSRTSWSVVLNILVIGHALCWSALFYLANMDNNFAPVSAPINLLTAGIGSGAIIALIPRYKLALLYVTLLLAPTGIAIISHETQPYYSAIITLYWLYLVFVGRRFRREYENAFNMQETLRSQKKELVRLNNIDPLTQVFNRLYFDTEYKKLWHQAQLEQSPIAVFMIDLDHFKSINDNHGHLFGDQCLIATAATIDNVVANDRGMVVRYGGEEFVAIVTDMDRQQAQALAQKLVQTIAQKAIQFDGIRRRLTASIGVCSGIPAQDENPAHMLSFADQALYQAKDQGRNQVVLHEDSKLQNATTQV